MNSFILAGGEIKRNGLALTHSLKTESMNGMIVVTERLAVDGEDYKGAIVSIGRDVVWLCSGSGLKVRADGVMTLSEHTFLRAKNLTPIKLDDEPKLITAEREVMA